MSNEVRCQAKGCQHMVDVNSGHSVTFDFEKVFLCDLDYDRIIMVNTKYVNFTNCNC